MLAHGSVVIRRRALTFALPLPVLLLLTGCSGPTGVVVVDAAPAQDATPVDAHAADRGAEGGAVPDLRPGGAAVLRVLYANVGNLDEVQHQGPCPPYHKGSQCQRSVERVIARAIARHDPDVVGLGEVFDTAYCAGRREVDPDRVCHPGDGLTPAQQARRLLGEGYTIACDGIAHFDCLAVRTGVLDMNQCPPGALCLGGARTPPHPPECSKRGGITSVSSVDVTWRELRFTLVGLHPLNAVLPHDDPCRLEQYRQALDLLLTDDPVLLVGDTNGDPARFPTLFASFAYWNTRVGPRRRLRSHLPTGDDGLPAATWQGLVTLDQVASDAFEGTCRVLGHERNEERLDAPLERMDHLAVLCDLWLRP